MNDIYEWIMRKCGKGPHRQLLAAAIIGLLLVLPMLADKKLPGGAPVWATAGAATGALAAIFLLWPRFLLGTILALVGAFGVFSPMSHVDGTPVPIKEHIIKLGMSVPILITGILLICSQWKKRKTGGSEQTALRAAVEARRWQYEMTDKVPCKECGALILPLTAADTGGYCKRCEWKRKPKLKPRKLSPEEERVERDWSSISRNICAMSPKDVLNLHCPSCGSGFRIGFSEGHFPGGSLGVNCTAYPKCRSGFHLDGLGKRPNWLMAFPPCFETDAKGGFTEIKDTRSEPQFKTGDVVVVVESSPLDIPTQGEVIEVHWNFSKSWWNYVISNNGNRCLRRFKDEDLKRVVANPTSDGIRQPADRSAKPSM